MFNKKMVAMMAKALAALIEAQEWEAQYFARKAKNARQSAAMIRELKPIIAEMLKPPKPFKMPRLSKAQARKLGIQTAWPIVQPAKASK